MLKLLTLPLGVSARSSFCEELAQEDYGTAVIVLPNALLINDVIKNYPGVEVLGMDRFANKILNMNGYMDLQEINARSQEFIVQDLLKILASEQSLSEKQRLEYFTSLFEKKGFIKAMTALTRELARAGLTEEEFTNIFNIWMENRTEGELKKDGDVLKLYTFYRQYLKNNNWYDLEGKFRLAIFALQQENAKFPWKKVYFADFYTMHKLQIKLIEAIAKIADVQCAINYEVDAVTGMPKKHFKAVESLYNSLKLLPTCQVASFASPQQALPTVSVVKLGNNNAEMRHVLTEVKQLLRAGTPASKIVVAVRKLDNYQGLRAIADEYGISVNLPKVSKLSVQPLVEFITNLLQAAHHTQEGLDAYFSLLESNFTSKVFGMDLKKPLLERQNRYFANREAVQQYLEEQNCQVRLVDEFLLKLPQEATMQAYCGAVQALLETLPLQDAFCKDGQSLEAFAQVCMTKQKLQALVQALVVDYANCGREQYVLKLADFEEQLRDAVRENELVLERGRADGVLLTEAVSLQGLSFDYVYLMGLREGEFPSVDNENWIYNDNERIKLAEAGLELQGSLESLHDDAYYFASACASARKVLTLTYYEDDQARASSYLQDMEDVFGSSVIFSKSEVKASVKPPASQEEQWQQVTNCDEAWLRATAGTSVMTCALHERERSIHPEYNGVLQDAEVVASLQKVLPKEYSASALEVYAACPFRYLGERVWNQAAFGIASEDVEPNTEGSLLHEVLAKFMEIYQSDSLRNYELALLADELEATFEDVCLSYVQAGAIVENVFWQVEKPRLWNLLLKWLRFEYAEQAKWAYKPVALEWDFGKKYARPLELTLADGSSFALRGRIDRIDTQVNADGSSKIFITDYKRSTVPGLPQLDKGLDLQLPVYILAAAKVYGKENVVGGAYYNLTKGERQSTLLLESIGRNDMPYKERKNGCNADLASFEEFCEATVKAVVEGVRAGKFAVAPNGTCSAYCALKDICRVQELALLEDEDDE